MNGRWSMRPCERPFRQFEKKRKTILTNAPQIRYNTYRCETATRDRGGIGIRARLRGVSDKGTGSSPVDRTKNPWNQGSTDFFMATGLLLLMCLGLLCLRILLCGIIQSGFAGKGARSLSCCQQQGAYHQREAGSMGDTEKLAAAARTAEHAANFSKTCKGCKLGYLDGSRDLRRARCSMKVCCLTRGHITCADCERFDTLRDPAGLSPPSRLQVFQIPPGVGVYPRSRLCRVYESGGSVDKRLGNSIRRLFWIVESPIFAACRIRPPPAKTA